MALRFGRQDGGLVSGLLLAAQTAFLAGAIGTGAFDASLSVSQTGSGTAVTTQTVSGTGSFAVDLAVSQEGTGRLPQLVFNTGSAVAWAAAVTASQDGSGVSEPPQAVSGTGTMQAGL